MQKIKLSLKAFLFMFFVSFVSLAFAEICSDVGVVQYKPSGTCGTSKRSCCSNGSWSGWDEDCPKTCDPATKPATTGSCGEDGSGTWSRTVTCDTSTLKWKTGSWGICSYCTPGAISTDWKLCDIPQKGVCNWKGTAYTCQCTNDNDRRNCMMGSGSSNQVRVWSTKRCSCYCCAAGASYRPADNYFGFECWKDFMQLVPTACLW